MIIFVMVFIVGFYFGRHISSHKESCKVFPLAIWYNRWVFVHRIDFQIYNRSMSFWYQARKDKQHPNIYFIPHYRWGTCGIYGTPHGDFTFPVCEYRWWSKVIDDIPRKKWMK